MFKSLHFRMAEDPGFSFGGAGGGAGDPPADPPGNPPPGDPIGKGKWYEGVDKDIFEDASLKAFLKPDGDFDGKGLLKSFVHAQKNIGRNKIPLPDKNTTPEEFRNILHQLGLPKDMKEYGVARDEKSPLAKEIFEGFVKKGFDIGVLPSQTKDLLKWYEDEINKHGMTMKESATRNRDAAITSLKAEWGGKFQEHMDAAGKSMSVFLSKEEAEEFTKRGLSSDPFMAKIFSKIGMSLKEDSFTKESEAGNQGMTLTEVTRRLGEIEGDAAYWKKGEARHDSLVNEAASLYKMREKLSQKTG